MDDEKDFRRMVEDLKSYVEGLEKGFDRFSKRHRSIIEKIRSSKPIKEFYGSELKPYIQRLAEVGKKLEEIIK
ncbi:MAG: hypothetical protein ACE5K3_10570 [bacterium]